MGGGAGCVLGKHRLWASPSSGFLSAIMGAGPGPCPAPPAEPVLLSCKSEATDNLATGWPHCFHYHRKVSSLAWEGGGAVLAPTFCLALALGLTGRGRIIAVSV